MRILIALLATLVFTTGNAQPTPQPEAVALCDAPVGDPWVVYEHVRNPTCQDAASILDPCLALLDAGTCLAVANRALDLPQNRTLTLTGEQVELPLKDRVLDPIPTLPVPTTTLPAPTPTLPSPSPTLPAPTPTPTKGVLPR